MEIYRTAMEPIAIIGIGCRFPGGIKDTETLWHVLIIFCTLAF